MKQVIGTNKAPKAKGTYSQAIKAGNTVYFAGQIPLVPETMQMVAGDFKEHVRQVFRNLAAVAEAAGGSLAQMVKLNVYLVEASNAEMLNEVMAEFYDEPYPARAMVTVKELPMKSLVEIEGVMVLGE
jgi:reactive intermediate/imine deaminase